MKPFELLLILVCLCAPMLHAGTGQAGAAVEGGGAAIDFSGDYVISDPTVPMTLHLEQSTDGVVIGQLSSPQGACGLEGELVFEEEEEDEHDVDDEENGYDRDDEDHEDEADCFVEGELHCESGRASIEFSADGDGFLLLVMPHDRNGVPDLARASVYSAQRVEAAPRARDRDPRLVGVWSTQVVMSTPQGSMATQLFMEIRGDGTLIDLGSRAMGSAAGVEMDTGLEGGGDVVAWRTQGDILEISSAGSAWVALARYELSQSGLFFRYHDGDQAIWYRQ